MASWGEIGLAVALGPPLWLAGAIGFDAVHWLLHAMLRSERAWLRRLAWPHAVHHQWVGRDLQVRWELRRRNVACHIVPEYGTQLAFSGGLALVLPGPLVAVVVGLQTALFAYILACRGLDPNHRPIERLDAHAPGFQPLPPYHALHHVHPDAHYSTYTKLVDWVVGGGIPVRGRRFRLEGSRGPLAEALAESLLASGAAGVSWEDAAPRSRAEPEARREARAESDAEDVWVLLDPRRDPAPRVEALAEATRARRLPPEVWCVRAGPDATARHYQRDVRVQFRVLLAPAEAGSTAEARRAVRRALFWIRRGLHTVPLRARGSGLAAYRAFRRARPVPPGAAPRIRHRTELATA